ncbi:putative transcription factor PIF1-like isoform 1 [Capsicum annuum]|nr:putative transcription factor PIF1-like isoform 1 [Capsicum annuum]
MTAYIYPPQTPLGGNILEIPCVKPEPEPASEEKLGLTLSLSASAQALHVDNPIYVDEPSEALNQSQLESIASSTEILEAIRNKELQKLICNLDSSLDAENELDKAMEKEEFRIFSEKVFVASLLALLSICI